METTDECQGDAVSRKYRIKSKFILFKCIVYKYKIKYKLDLIKYNLSDFNRYIRKNLI